MKKLALSLFLLALSVSVLCISASAQINSGNCGDNITWMLDTETGHLELMGSGAMWDYDHTPGAVVEAPWQAYKKSIKSVSIGNGITHIGNYAFYYITDINSVTIPESVTTIGNNAFSYCMNLKSIELPDGITQLANSVFYSCKQLKIDKLPSSLTELGKSAFTDCDSLTYLEIPMGVTTIHEGTFNYCDLLSTLIIPNNNATIERFSLYDCPKLVVYSRSDSVITYCALYNIPRKSPVSLPSKTETLPLDENATDNGICGGNTYWNYYANEGKLVISGTYRTYDYEYTYAFGGSYTAPWKKYADHITTVEVQTGVTGLGEFCFSGMKNISKIYLPEGLNYLGDYAFFECNSLTSIALPKSFATSYSCTFPQSLTEVQGYAGTYAESFAKNNNYVFASFESFLFDGTLSNTATWSLNTKAGILTINGSGHIPDYEYGTAPWYEYRYAIKTIELSDKITRIGNNAFHMCKSLVEIKIPDSIKSFGSECFCACENLKEIHIPDGTTVIPDSAFSSCRSIESIYLPDSVTTISNHAFSNCNKLKEIRIPDSVTSIGNSAFNGTAITSFTVPPHVTELKFLTFKNCSNLTYINIHKNVTQIDENIFYNSEVAICGYKGSTAENFAKDNGIPFIDLESKSGDCNGDGTIDLKDVTAIRRYLAGGYKSAVAEPALDVNSDGIIDLKDVTAIRRYLAGGYGIEIE